MNFTPLSGKLLARKVTEHETESGLYLPEGTKGSTQKIEILRVSEDSEITDRYALVHPKAGKPIEFGGHEYIILKEDQLLALVEE